ncbi:unnamed protein product [Prorocentrum cordatum]|uniref:Uncharacterized protein n=1 Tax=Prorocentrum cordatum TaxID=2364126 RepID=A0ABN9TA03_9DINO|nr:unnamed protein product [Polarella glacialis]
MVLPGAGGTLANQMAAGGADLPEEEPPSRPSVGGGAAGDGDVDETLQLMMELGRDGSQDAAAAPPPQPPQPAADAAVALGAGARPPLDPPAAPAAAAQAVPPVPSSPSGSLPPGEMETQEPDAAAVEAMLAAQRGEQRAPLEAATAAGGGGASAGVGELPTAEAEPRKAGDDEDSEEAKRCEEPQRTGAELLDEAQEAGAAAGRGAPPTAEAEQPPGAPPAPKRRRLPAAFVACGAGAAAGPAEPLALPAEEGAGLAAGLGAWEAAAAPDGREVERDTPGADAPAASAAEGPPAEEAAPAPGGPAARAAARRRRGRRGRAAAGEAASDPRPPPAAGGAERSAKRGSAPDLGVAHRLGLRPRPAAPAAARARRGPARPARPAGAADGLAALRVRLGVCGGLGGVLLATQAYGRRVGAPREDDPEGACHPEYAWVSGARGPFAGLDSRALAVGPLGACCGSAALAVLTAVWFPGRVAWVAMNSQLHEVLAGPLAILMAFRFQTSHSRWWSARNEVEQLASGIIDVALLAPSCGTDAGLRGGTAQEEALGNETRLLGLLDALCYFAEEQLMRGQGPHEANVPPSWSHWSKHLSSIDLDECPRMATRSPVAGYPNGQAEVRWCLSRIVECVQAGQSSGAFTPEKASQLHSLVQNILDSLRLCDSFGWQREPSSYIVHLRTFLYMYCFTFPWTLVGKLPPAGVLPMQLVVSYALLGIEFCSREMDYPFGDDEGDVPVRRILAGVREEISRSHNSLCQSQPAAGPAPPEQGHVAYFLQQFALFATCFLILQGAGRGVHRLAIFFTCCLVCQEALRGA